MEYWHEMQTEKSWKILQRLKGKFPFVLIGGWAVYLWARSHKSKDIDIVVDFSALPLLKKSYDFRKNDILKKYEIKVDEIDVDIYVKNFSPLVIPPQKIESTMIEGFSVAKPEFLLILKQGAELNRKDSVKGEKDRIDIMDILMKCDIDFKKYSSILKANDQDADAFARRLIFIVKSSDSRHFGLNPREMKLAREKLLAKLRTAFSIS